MTLKFEINNNIISKGHSYYIPNDDSGDLFASFVFNTKDWRHLEKYAIFWNRKGKSTIRYITDKSHGSCPIPRMALDDLYFYVQVYANDDIKTNKIQVGTTRKEHQGKCKKPIKKCSSIFYDIYQQLEQKIDNIEYIDNTFYIYSNNKLIKTVELYDKNLIKELIEDQLIKLNVDSELSEESENPLQNKVIYEELNKKENSNNLSRVSRTGDYNDLNNKPNEFPPSKHTHSKEDLDDFDISVDTDIELMLMKITDDILGL